MIFNSMFNLAERMINVVILGPYMHFLLTYLDPLMSITPMVDRQMDRMFLQVQNQDTTFDYIIVGGGSAGAILASRLSKDATARVLLLEAGGEPSIFLNTPTLAYNLNNKKSHDWAFRTVPQKHAAKALNNRVCFWTSGKALGGSSLLNGLIYLRGNVQGYDLIANRTGDPLWRTENILRYYRKVENYHGWFNKSDHGTTGEMQIEAPTLVPLTYHFLRAGQEMGYRVRDPNANSIHEEGFAPIDFYMRKGDREDAYKSSLKKYRHRPNLVIRKYSFVTKLHFHPGNGNHVSGVEYERHGKVYIVKADRETILSAGALSTPKILMLSGIGPKEHLTELNIPVRLNLPVGGRVQDKYGALIGPFIVKRGYSFNQDRDFNMSSLMDYWMYGRGLLSAGRTEGTFAILSDTAKTHRDTFSPDISSYFLSQTPVNPKYPFGASFNFKDEVLNYMEKSVQYGDGFFQLVTLNRGLGFGTFRLANKDPYTPPLIDPKYLEHPHDLKILVEGIKFAVDLIEKTNTMKEIGAQLFRLPYPGCETFMFKSHSYYECLATHATATAFKYCGTATIGSEHDPEAVVDSRFRVFGTKGLRVIDSSLFRITEVNTNDVTMRMVGELGAQVIKSAWQ